MKAFFTPLEQIDEWQRRLPEAERQNQPGSAGMTLAKGWFEARGLPLEAQLLFYNSVYQAFRELSFTAGFPEYPLLLPGGVRPAHADLLALVQDADQHLITLLVEGRISEPPGPTIDEWAANPSPARQQRLDFFQQQLGLSRKVSGQARYALLHRAAAALQEAQRFSARKAVFMIHSFSPDDHGFADFRAFVRLFGKDITPNQLLLVRQYRSIDLYVAWLRGSRQPGK